MVDLRNAPYPQGGVEVRPGLLELARQHMYNQAIQRGTPTQPAVQAAPGSAVDLMNQLFTNILQMVHPSPQPSEMDINDVLSVILNNEKHKRPMGSSDPKDYK